ncbi:MAG TPA: glycosyltransferase family A protein [Dehalococcoidia bacterium]|nr:glycosyltransferase family A protein [Dehalococcoidia bacterium]
MSLKVSVIIPVYNGEAFLRAAIASAFAQTYEPHEVIVIDDGSTDGSAAIAKSFPVVYAHQENQGLAATRNAAIAMASGDVFALLDCDDIWVPAKLAEQVTALQNEPEAGYALSGIRYFWEFGQAGPAWFHNNSPDPEYDPSYPPSTWMIRRAAFERVGPFKVDRLYVEDIDWLARAQDLGVKSVMIPKALTLKRMHEENMTSKLYLIHKGMLDSLRESAARKRAMGEGK